MSIEDCTNFVASNSEQAYFIAFSLLILHTDVFNKNNKRKMQKHDYVRNTRGEGLAEEILECFYDNISYTPFIHVEDEINHGVRRLAPKTRSPLFKVSSSDNLAKGPLDPYALILEGKLHILRPNLKDVMELDDVYSASGPGYTLDMNGLHEAFYRPCVLQIVSERSRPDAFMKQSSIANPLESQPGLVDIRVAKVGLLWRKDPKKKKTRSPWQEWGAVLTGSQLYLFKDVPWVKTLISQYETKQKRGRRQPVIFKPPITDFKPDAIMSTADAVALLDASYKRHKHAFLFVRHGGFEEVFLANSDTEMNDWMATINYGAAFRTTGVRMRGMIGANYEGQPPQRTVRSSSVTSETSETPTVSELTTSNTRTMDPRLAEEIFAARRELVSTRIREANEKLSECNEQLEDLLRNARHLQILMPLHPRARDQVVLAAGRMAAKIKWARLEVWRTKCHRDVLALDLAEEEKGLSVKKVAKSCSPSRNEAFSISSQDHALPSESAPSLVPTSPKSTRSSKQFRSRSPTPTGEARNPEKLVENLPPQVLRPGLPKARTSTDLTISSRKTSSSENKDSLNVDSMKRMGNSVPVLRQVSATSSSSRLDPNATPRQSSAQRAPKTPTPSMLDTEEDRLLREAGILSNELLTHMSSTSDPVDGSSNTGNDGRGDTPSSESRGKVRRSLHRTLREGHFIPHHQRSKKGKDSGTTVSTVDEANPASETEVLARSTGSFTLHGKKASVVTFGSEWENISPEQRLKQRKPMPSEDSRASDMMELDSQSDATPSENTNLRKTYSLRSISTATGRSLRLRDGERLGVLPSPGASLTDTLREELTAAMDTDSAVIMEEEETFYDAGEVPVTPTEQTEKLPSPSSEEQTPIVAESELETGLSKCDHSSPVLNHAVAEQTVRVQ